MQGTNLRTPQVDYLVIARLTAGAPGATPIRYRPLWVYKPKTKSYHSIHIFLGPNGTRKYAFIQSPGLLNEPGLAHFSSPVTT